MNSDKLRDLILDKIEPGEIPDAVSKILKKFDGKRISKRMATAVEKAMPECKIYWRYEYGMYHLNVTHGCDEYRFLIGYDSTKMHFDHKQWRDQFACCYLGAREKRNEKRVRLASKNAWLENAAKLSSEYSYAKEEFRRAKEAVENGSGWDLIGELSFEVSRILKREENE